MDKTFVSKFMSELKSVGCIDPETVYRISNVDAIKSMKNLRLNPETLAEVIGDLQRTSHIYFKRASKLTIGHHLLKLQRLKILNKCQTDELKERV